MRKCLNIVTNTWPFGWHTKGRQSERVTRQKKRQYDDENNISCADVVAVILLVVRQAYLYIN